ncbi:hypothetical protein BD410DRAFT_324840 [Rickenella mellea]|uniref:Uncharacterized protein n=1 Tax=Rickenella mellea TaxID=50990 RepID=A0A4Y7QJ46_9AGAM|nr:hypothetical protein BD410DRAFT_324840 [Rickenella mellea]
MTASAQTKKSDHSDSNYTQPRSLGLTRRAAVATMGSQNLSTQLHTLPFSLTRHSIKVHPSAKCDHRLARKNKGYGTAVLHNNSLRHRT